MKRQNSIPQPLKQLHESNQRRSSHEISHSSTSVNVNGVGLMANFDMSGPKEFVPMPSILTVEGSNNISSAKRVTLTEETIGLPGSVSTSSQTITFGYASGLHHFQNDSYDYEASTSESKEIEVEDETMTETNEHQTGLFYVRNSDGTTISMYCHQPVGEEADQFLYTIGNRYKEKLKRFIENEKAEDGEHYVWIRTDLDGKTTVLSLTQLRNHFNNAKVKRVKWRHLSIERITVYRYSVPIITTKFRLRVMHFLSRNYRCCILCIWCFVILFISVGIVLSVVFGSAPYLNSMTKKNVTTGYMFSR